MIIVRTTWAQVPDGTLVVSPSTGRIMTMVGKFADQQGRPYVSLLDPTDPDGDQLSPYVDPNGTIDMIETALDLSRAVDILSQSFAMNRM